ncbi:MAG: hypothetical protein ABSA65_16290 [Acidimicrobiales bacterium]|jgi:hypothetical protein
MFTVKQLRELLAFFPDNAPVTMTDRQDEKFMLEDFTGSMVESPHLSFTIPGVVCRE